MILEFKGVSKSYGKGDALITVLNKADFSLNTGEIVALMAPSGAGKSTFLHIAGLLDTPTSGDVMLESVKTNDLSDDKKSALRSKTLGFVYQFHHLLPEFTSLENVVLPQLLQGVSESQAQKRAKELLEHLNLDHRLSHRPSQLSGGEQQRVAIARALANNPKVLLADEPTGNLDLKTGDIVFQELLEIVKKTGLSCLIATHNLELAKKMDRIVTLKEGKLESLT